MSKEKPQGKPDGSTRLAPVSGSGAGQSRDSEITRCKICGCGGLPWWWVFCEDCIAKVRDEEERKMSKPPNATEMSRAVTTEEKPMNANVDQKDIQASAPASWLEPLAEKWERRGNTHTKAAEEEHASDLDASEHFKTVGATWKAAAQELRAEMESASNNGR